jgi:hypothetical protein
MKKVAICLKGAISKVGKTHDRFYYKNDVYREGQYIDYESVSNSIFKHIVDTNKNYEFDFFLHSWNYDLKNELNELYKPKKSQFEDNNLYNDIISSILKTPEDFGGVSGSLSTKKSIELKEIYEIENRMGYDIVIIYRYDVLLWKDLLLDNYDTENFIYVNAWRGSKNGDFHFVMSNENSHRFKYLYDSVSLYNNLHSFHYWIRNYIENIIKTPLTEDTIEAGVFQEHMRVIGDNSPLQEKLTDYIKKINDTNIT